MKKCSFYLLIVCVLILGGCKNKANNSPVSDYEKVVIDRENNAGTNPLKIDGTRIKEILFEVKTDNKEFENGIQTWVSIQNFKKESINLINKDEVVISEKEITIIIDYPLTNVYSFNLKSEKGFTREKLLTEIGENYFKLYEEEEKSASVKTQPMEEREMYNRNQTNGKYGIWGHDIADLVLTDIQVFKNKDGKLIVSLGIDS
ncbi:hypothetical protein [Flavobacterium hungaricum]|nr:hypothetical protein [Flavobacterium hungaricum]